MKIITIFLTSLIACNSFAAFATIESTTSGIFGANATSHELTLPATISADAVILGCVSIDNGGTTISTTETGVSELLETVTSGPFVAGACYCKAADGTEDGTSWTIDLNQSETGHFVSYSIQGTFDDTCSSLEAATDEDGGSATTTVDPPDLNPTGWGTEDTRWIALGFANDNGDTISSYPSGCTENQLALSFATGYGKLSACHVNSAAANYNPGVFTWNAAERWESATVGIRPAAAAGGLLRRRR